ncbi:MAG: hypothetical protein O3A88_07900 [Proteobacteria bacterium]|nr:hypothetical protein [Pseudomonadota bacterium]
MTVRVFIMRDGKMVEKKPTARPVMVEVVSDIAPYQSMIDGSMITGRAQHRMHLRDHNCIEIGNEKMETKLTLPSREKRRRVLREQLTNMTDRQADRIMADIREQASQMASRRR